MKHVFVSEIFFFEYKIRMKIFILKDALATTTRNCIHGLRGIPELRARYYCGFRLMQNCAKQIGLERFPYRLEYQKPDDD